MRASLLWKLTLAFVVVALTTAGLVAVFIRVTSVDRLARLIVDQERSSFVEWLTTYYGANGSWDGVAQAWQESGRMKSVQTLSDGASEPGAGPPPHPNPRPVFGLADAQGTVIISVEAEYPPGSQASPSALKTGTAVMVDGKQVGTILTARWVPGLNQDESRFLERTNEALILGGVVAVVVAAAIGLLLARALSRPLSALTRAAQNIAQGHLDQRVKFSSSDEIGQLAHAFNRMSQEVARVNQLRRQMTADIAHDLRTPLTVIAGYVESMRDGVIQPTPERLALIYAEIERLQNLVGDLRVLSQADAGELSINPQPLSPHDLLVRAAAVFQHRAEQQNITLSVEADESLPCLNLDEARMMQVLDNLLSNALRYTPAGGRINLSARRSNGKVVLSVSDNGTGIATEELPYIFERLHRADRSRHTEEGETGLGLAIVKALVEAHGGTVGAESTPGAGTSIHIELPLSAPALACCPELVQNSPDC